MVILHGPCLVGDVRTAATAVSMAVGPSLGLLRLALAQPFLRRQGQQQRLAQGQPQPQPQAPSAIAILADGATRACMERRHTFRSALALPFLGRQKYA